MLIAYENYLSFLDSRLEKFFKSQEPYIFCKKGCTKCCRHAQFPYSLLEMQYVLAGLHNLDKKTLNKIEQNLANILTRKQKFKGKKFLYDCPFLINDECAVYKYRGVICRTFGLITQYENGTIKSPFCAHKGLNYSNVLNLRQKTISIRKFKKLNVKEEPLGFNISYEFLTGSAFEAQFNLKFGQMKPLIEWFQA